MVLVKINAPQLLTFVFVFVSQLTISISTNWMWRSTLQFLQLSIKVSDLWQIRTLTCDLTWPRMRDQLCTLPRGICGYVLHSKLQRQTSCELCIAHDTEINNSYFNFSSCHGDFITSDVTDIIRWISLRGIGGEEYPPFERLLITRESVTKYIHQITNIYWTTQ